jgi:hypothetical protein
MKKLLASAVIGLAGLGVSSFALAAASTLPLIVKTDTGSTTFTMLQYAQGGVYITKPGSLTPVNSGTIGSSTTTPNFTANNMGNGGMGAEFKFTPKAPNNSYNCDVTLYPDGSTKTNHNHCTVSNSQGVLTIIANQKPH